VPLSTRLVFLIPSPKIQRSGLRYVVFSVSANVRTAFTGLPADGVTAALSMKLFTRVAVHLPAVGNIMHPLIIRDILVSPTLLQMTIQAIQANTRPTIGYFSRDCGMVNIQQVKFDKAFSEYVAQCRYSICKVLIHKEFLGTLHQGMGNLISKLMTIRQAPGFFNGFLQLSTGSLPVKNLPWTLG
jgi:hypothetical protein